MADGGLWRHCEQLYLRFPEEHEGQLAKRRSALVSTVALAEIAQSLGLGAYLRLGRGELHTGGRAKASILADTVEDVPARIRDAAEGWLAAMHDVRREEAIRDVTEPLPGESGP